MFSVTIAGQVSVVVWNPSDTDQVLGNIKWELFFQVTTKMV